MKKEQVVQIIVDEVQKLKEKTIIKLLYFYNLN